MNGFGDAAGGADVVVLEQYPVGQIVTVVGSAAYLNGVLLKGAHIGCGLAGVQQHGIVACQLVHIFSGDGGNAAHTLEVVQRRALAGENGLNVAVQGAQQLALLHPVAVLHRAVKAGGIVQQTEGAEEHIQPADHAVVLTDQLRAALLVYRHHRVGGHILVVNILF